MTEPVDVLQIRRVANGWIVSPGRSADNDEWRVMPCSWIDLPNGGTAIVKHTRKKHGWCKSCGGYATLQCDFPLPSGLTCDAWLCRSCAVRKAPNVDWCPDHTSRPSAPAEVGTGAPPASAALAQPVPLTPGERYAAATLVRIVGTDHRDRPFTAGILIDPVTQRSFFAAPILGYLVGQHADQLRRTFNRLGWRATIVKRSRSDAGPEALVREQDHLGEPDRSPGSGRDPVRSRDDRGTAGRAG